MAVTQKALGERAHGCDSGPIGASTEGENRTYILAGLPAWRECDTRNVLLFTCSAGFDAGTVFSS